MTHEFDADYFLRGTETGKSLYHDYRWIPDLTIPMVRRIIDHCGILLSDRVLDFGCSRGYVVKAFRELGHDAYGMDISRWAIENADESVNGKVEIGERPTPGFDWIISKDVLEHVPFLDLGDIIACMSLHAKKGVFIVVPLAGHDGQYTVPEYEQDITHIVRWRMSEWVSEFQSYFGPEWEISSRYLIDGIKQNYAQHKEGNGFITIRKLS